MRRAQAGGLSAIHCQPNSGRIEHHKIGVTQVPNAIGVTTIEADSLADVVTNHRCIERSANHWKQVPTGITWHPGREDGRMAGDAIGLSPA
jgi:hypothetical protein